MTKEHRAELLSWTYRWLSSGLSAWKTKSTEEDKLEARLALMQWMHDPDCAVLRDGFAGSKLSESQRTKWRNFWKQVEAAVDSMKPAPLPELDFPPLKEKKK